MNDHGLGGKHLFPEIKKCIVALGRKSVKDVDTAYVNCLSLLWQPNYILSQNGCFPTLARSEPLQWCHVIAVL